ncbi:MAG TPA: tyrosine-type recombinase/integrase, partial [Blastocatellia bacterium]|nr:tyrosine-type recombinase/integrase [Blastocatellia bacterium]
IERKRRVHSVADALSKIEQIKQELGLLEPACLDGERMTFADLMKEYEKARKISKWYKDPLLDHFGDRRIRSITYGDVEQFKRARAQVPKKYTEDTPRSPATINREMEILRSIFLYALRHEWILKNPFSKGPATLIKKSEETSRYRIPSTEEEARILEFCTDFKSWIEQKRTARGMTAEDLAGVVGLDIADRIERGERLKDREITQVADVIGVNPLLAIKVAEGDRSHLRAILIAAKDTGLRRGALMSLTWSMVGFKVEDGQTVIGDFIRIPKGPRNKKRPPAIGITARLREELSKLWQKSDKNPTSQIFGGVHEIKRSYNTVCRIAGVVDLHFHDWRHGYATDMVEAGVEERLAMLATGHSNPETHAIYTNVDERLAREIARRLDDLHQKRQGGESAIVEANNFIN